MPWYKAGTVSCTQNSNAVIGVGTAFIANARVGDALRGPDGGWYEVTNIASDTAMSISPNYQGATNSAGIYALAPMQGYVKDSADALRALVNQFGGVIAVLGTTPTTAGVRTALNLSTTDDLTEGAANLYFSAARAIASALAGLVTTTDSPVVATDSIVIAAGKLQAQIAAALPKAGGTLTGPINDAPTQTIASAATVDIGAASSNVVAISGTTTVTGLGTIAAGARRTVRFLGSLTLTHNATSLILPNAASIATAVNDTAEFLSLGAGNWFCLRYSLATEKALPFSFNRSNILGTVGQTSGVPTGAIIETGSNAAGTYTKYADGTMICRGNPGGIDQTVANTAYSTTFGLPAGFVGAYSVFANVTGVNVGNVFYGYSRVASVTATTYNIIQCWSLVQTYTYSIIAMGRWY